MAVLPLIPPVAAALGEALVVVGEAIAAAVVGVAAVETADSLAKARAKPATKADATTDSCSTCGDPDDPCKKAADEFDKVLKGKGEKSISQRRQELLEDKHKQPWFWEDANPGIPRPPGSDRWGHVVQIAQQQTRLSKQIQSYYENNCNNVDDSVIQEAFDEVMKDPFPEIIP